MLGAGRISGQQPGADYTRLLASDPHGSQQVVLFGPSWLTFTEFPDEPFKNGYTG
jgi:hypothetical protein